MAGLPSMTMVLGGAASGKSTFAEQAVNRTAQGLQKTYIATAQAFDAEMRDKIARHQEARAADGWTTIEEPLALAPILQQATARETILLDCATLWLTNQLMAEADLSGACDALMDALARCAAPVVVVTNEVGQGIVPEHAISRRFREAQGRLNQRMAQQADLVVQVIAGLPLVLKGQLPTELS